MNCTNSNDLLVAINEMKDEFYIYFTYADSVVNMRKFSTDTDVSKRYTRKTRVFNYYEFMELNGYSVNSVRLTRDRKSIVFPCTDFVSKLGLIKTRVKGTDTYSTVAFYIVMATNGHRFIIDKLGYYYSVSQSKRNLLRRIINTLEIDNMTFDVKIDWIEPNNRSYNDRRHVPCTPKLQRPTIG